MRRLFTHANLVRASVVVAPVLSIVLMFLFVGEDVGVLGPTQAMSRVISVLGILSLVVGVLLLMWGLPKPVFASLVFLVIGATLIYFDDVFGGRPTSISGILHVVFWALGLMFSILITLLPAVSVIMIILAILLVLSVQDSQNAKMRRGYIAVTFLIVGGFILGGSLRYEYQEMVATYVHDDHLYAARVYYASSDPDALKLFDCNRWGFGCEPIFDGRGYYHTTLFSIVPNEGQDGFALMKGTETLYTHLYQDEGV